VSKACKLSGSSSVAIQETVSGKRVRNTLAIYPAIGNNPPKGGLIPRWPLLDDVRSSKAQNALREEPMAYQLVGGVTAHQGYDGYGV
jgi:hypothetical protein